MDKDNKFNLIGVLALRNAIVIQAAKDYLQHYEKNKPNSKHIANLEKWFRSYDFELLGTGIDPEWFIEQLRKMSDNGEKIGNRKEYDSPSLAIKVQTARKVRRKNGC